MTEEIGAVTLDSQPALDSAAQAAEPSQFDSPYWTGAEDRSGVPGAGFAGVRFQRAGKVYHYLSNGFALKVGNWVIVDTPRGRQMGQVATLNPPRNKNDGPFKKIERLATGRDMAMRHYYETKELEAMIACRAESSALGLPIKIVRAEYSFDGQTLTFLYSTDQEERVETGELRQVMSRLYRARIEMRQISPREVAKILGGMGACGIEERCCSRFLTEFSPVSIKHAKEQNLSLNPHDITGMCGRLRCCLIYEYEQYVEARRHLPKLKSVVGTPLGPGKVVEILHLRDSVRVKIGEGPEAREVEFHREQIVPLEEWRRLQEKAASGTCDRHSNGECDCSRGKQAEGDQATPPATGGAPLPPAARAYIQANEARQNAEQPRPAATAKKADRKPRGERRPTDVGRQQPRTADSSDADQARSKRRPLLKRKPGK